jgi:hypothetical protein
MRLDNLPLTKSRVLANILQLSVGRMALKDNSQHTHLHGALALIRHRGAANFTGTLSLAVLLYVRSLVVCSKASPSLLHDLTFLRSTRPSVTILQFLMTLPNGQSYLMIQRKFLEYGLTALTSTLPASAHRRTTYSVRPIQICSPAHHKFSFFLRLP